MVMRVFRPKVGPTRDDVRMSRDPSRIDDRIEPFARYGTRAGHTEPGVNWSEAEPKGKQRELGEHVDSDP
jgi:hypothetical protein